MRRNACVDMTLLLSLLILTSAVSLTWCRRGKSSDMSQPYLCGIAENFPNAVSVIDRFHVKQVLIRAPDTVRKAEQQAAADKRTLFRADGCS